jgi:hypothetical protein
MQILNPKMKSKTLLYPIQTIYPWLEISNSKMKSKTLTPSSLSILGGVEL